MLRSLPVGAEGRSQGRDAEAGARQAVLVSGVLRLKRGAWPRGGAQQVVRKHPERQIMTLKFALQCRAGLARRRVSAIGLMQFISLIFLQLSREPHTGSERRRRIHAALSVSASVTMLRIFSALYGFNVTLFT